MSDSDDEFAGLLRASAGLGIPLFGNTVLELIGRVEYLTHSPTISRTSNAAVVVAGDEAGALAGTAGGVPVDPVPLASLDFEDMFAYMATARIVIPFGD